MKRIFHFSSGISACALGLVALTSCSDPSDVDFSSHMPPAVTGGAAGNTSSGTGGTGVGGSPGTGASVGAGGTTGVGGEEPPPPEEEICPASPGWFPVTPTLRQFKPPPHPATECDFYRGGMQTFLLATQPHPDTGEPNIKYLPTIDDLFTKSAPLPAGALAPLGQPRGTALRSWLGDIKQAGGRQILIDQNGHTIYYGIHVNQGFVDFVRANHLETAKAIQNADPTLFFPAGVAEFKTAWQQVDEDNPPDDIDTYVTTKAWVPHITQDPTSHLIIEDRDHPLEVMVRLLAIHAVFTLPGHPEFIWATMEHSVGTPDTRAADGMRNVAPIDPRDKNPSDTDPNNQRDTTVVSPEDHLLYKAGTTLQAGNQAISDENLRFDEPTQTFRLVSGGLAETSIYRMFPASKSNTIDPDDAITSLNHNFEALFAEYEEQGQLLPTDRRGHYRLVGAQWMDKPAFFDTNKPLQNDTTSPLILGRVPAVSQDDERQAILAGGGTAIGDLAESGADSPFSMLAGEDRLSSTAMESFTQAPDSFRNCFTCHNTQAITAKGVPLDKDRSGVRLIEPKQLNVSHVLSEFVLEECNVAANLRVINNADGSMTTAVICP
jgi:hypothetical protein